MVKLSDLLDDKSLHGLNTYRRDVIQFVFRDVIYHKRHCNVDTRRRNVIFSTT